MSYITACLCFAQFVHQEFSEHTTTTTLLPPVTHDDYDDGVEEDYDEEYDQNSYHRRK